MKRRYLPLFVLSTSLLALVGCNHDDQKQPVLSLVHHSRAFHISVNPDSGTPLDTYYAVNEGSVPYVSLSQYAAALGSKEAFDTYSVVKKDGIYSVFEAFGETEETAQKYEIFRFDPSANSVTFLKDAKRHYRYFSSVDPLSQEMKEVFLANPEKTKRTALWETKAISFRKYDFTLRELNGELYAPFGLFQTVFSEGARPEGDNPFIFNGLDYYTIATASGNRASCLSSSLHFRYRDVGLQTLAMQVTDTKIPYELDFAPVNPDKGETYRFETEKIATIEFTPPGEANPRKAVPDFKIRLTLDNQGKGQYVYIDASTDKPFEIEKLGLLKRDVQYKDSDDLLFLGILPAKEGAEGNMIRLHKKETFFDKEGRSSEYATYEYNLTRLHFAEFYGLKSRNLDVDSLIAPYKEKLCSPSYEDFNEGMSRFLFSAVDDGHTSIQGYSVFGKQSLESKEEREKVNSYMGYRRKGLFNVLDAMKAYREAAGVKAGYEVVGDTAYLAFDGFHSAPNKLSDYTESPNQYVSSNSLAFVYTALKDVAANHKEVTRIVYDLSCNVGGDVSSMPFLLATMSADPTLPLFNYYGGELVEAHYKVDLNGDGVYGGTGDTYQGKYKFVILDSPMSFSCGNAFPGYAKALKCATIVGTVSGGGGSVVDQVTTVSGYSYNSSSPLSFATVDKDGKYVENDAGIPVDAAISIDKFYHRSALNQTLDKLNIK